MKKSVLYFHLGYPKTASTYLQNNVFTQLDNIFYIGKYNKGTVYWNGNKYTNQIIDKFHQYCLSYNKEEVKFTQEDRKYLITYLQKAAKDKDILFSHEKYCIFLYDLDSILKRFKECLGNSFIIKPIIVLRKQDDAIYSIYSMWKTRFAHSLEEMYYDQGKSMGLFDGYDYLTKIKILNRNFGIKNICILIYEQIQINNKLFFNNLCNFLKNKQAVKFISDSLTSSYINTQPKINQHYYKKYTIHDFITLMLTRYQNNKFFKINLHKIYIGRKVIKLLFYLISLKLFKINILEKKINLSEDVRNKIFDSYKESNNTLEKSLKVNMSYWK